MSFAVIPVQTGKNKIHLYPTNPLAAPDFPKVGTAALCGRKFIGIPLDGGTVYSAAGTGRVVEETLRLHETHVTYVCINCCRSYDEDL